MGFGELNRLVFRDDASTDPIQLIINQHSREDDSHWIWFLEDLAKLEWDTVLNLTDALKFLWSDATQSSRHMVYELYRLTYKASPIQKLVVIEAVESTADIFLSATAQVARELQAITNREYRYFGNLHFAIDSSHSLGLSETEAFIEALELSDEARAEAYEQVEHVFQLFTDFFDVMLNVAQASEVKSFMPADANALKQLRPRTRPSFITANEKAIAPSSSGKRLGTYLVEAGLLTTEQLERALDEQEKTAKRLGEVVSDRGWVNQQTIEYLMEKVIMPEREQSLERSLSLVG